MDNMSMLKLDFAGPFTFTGGDNSLFSASCAVCAGVYLWTIRQRSDGSHLIHYVGETASFAKRQREHLIHILGLNYGIFDYDKAQNGVCELIWPGLWRDRSLQGPSRQIEAYRSIHDSVLRYLSVLTVSFAELTVDKQLRRHIEGCIGWDLRNNHPEARVLYPDDNHVGAMHEKNHGELLISSSESIRGLDSQIPY